VIRNTLSTDRGFTLVETLVALVILATGMVAILLLFPATLDRQRVNTQRTMVTSYAQGELGKLQGRGTEGPFKQWLEQRRFRLVDEDSMTKNFIKASVISCQPVGELHMALYRVTLGLRLHDDSVEYFTTYVTDR
jgi:prepilin-type N-terminal cleavage/methylation domain-containing protein